MTTVSKPKKKTGTKKKSLSLVHQAILNTFPELDDDPTGLQPSFVCGNNEHSPRHIAHGSTQKKGFTAAFGCKKWKAVK